MTTEKNNNLTETKILLARIDERTKHLEQEIGEIIEKLDRDYVSREEFTPVKRVVYGMVGVILFTALVTILRMVISQ